MNSPRHSGGTSPGFQPTSLLTRTELLDHVRHPRNRVELPDADIVREEVNPMCGDEVTVYVTIDRKAPCTTTATSVRPGLNGERPGLINHDSRLTRVSFTGHGCILSQAAASLLTEHAHGKTADDIRRMELSDMERLLGGSVSPSRVTCALLALVALKEGLRAFRGSVSSEQ